MLITYGHGAESVEHTVAALREARVGLVVDIRIAPGSKRHPQFGLPELQRWLPEAGIAYRWEKRLGGYRKPSLGNPDIAWREDMYRGYAEHMRGAEFLAAIDAVLADAMPAGGTPTNTALANTVLANTALAKAARANGAPGEAMPAEAMLAKGAHANAALGEAMLAHGASAEAPVANAALADAALAKTVPANTPLANTVPAYGVLTDAVPADAPLANAVPADGVPADGVLADGVPADAVLADAVLANAVLADVGDAAGRVAVMCSEGSWCRCHRRLVADFVQAGRGIEVCHLAHDGSLVPHVASPGLRLREDGLLIYDFGQAALL